MRSELTVAFGTALVGVVLGGIVSDRSIRALAESDRRLSQTHQALEQVRAVRITLTDAEAGQRGFLLTGREEYLAPYTRAAAELPAELVRLETLTAYEPGQRDRVQRLRRVAEERLDALRQVVDMRRDPAQGLPAVIRFIEAGRGAAMMAELRRLAAEVEAGEQLRLEERSAAAAAADRSAGRTLAAVTTSVAVLFGAVVALVRRHVRGRERATVALRASEERFRELADAMPQVVWVLSPDGRVEYVNRRADETLGPVDLLAPAAPVHPADRPALADHLARGLAAGEPFECEYRLRVQRTGEFRWHLSRSVPIRDAGGRVVRWYGTATDVHDLKRAEAERADLLVRLTLQIERMPLAYLLTDSGNRYTHWNPAAERTFGFARADVLGKRPFEVIIPARSRALAESTFARLATGDMDAHGLQENVTKDGKEITCEWHNTPLFDSAGAFQGVLSLAQDVTGRQRLAEQFRQAQKMEAIGHLAGGVAHDFNNLLTVINGYAALLLKGLPSGDPSEETLAEILAAGRRAEELTRQLMAFGRQQLLRPRVLDLNELVTNLQKMLVRLIGEDVRLATTLAPVLSRVAADPGQLEQVIVNLCVNARDAMPKGGRLTLVTDEMELRKGRAGPHSEVPPGRYTRLAVTDTGHGMTADVRAQIFEPFFTTKGAGKGTGLGLATVFGIVKQSGGHVTVDSTLGAGTTFTVYLPVTGGALPAEPPARRPEAPPRGGETVLLVEDERAVRVFAARALRDAGYAVLEATDGAEAMRVYATRSPVHLLLTDVVMPGMSGRELAECLRERDPRLRVTYMSGYTDDAVVRHGVLSAEVEFVQKPFEVSDLLWKVRQVLDGPSARPRAVPSKDPKGRHVSQEGATSTPVGPRTETSCH